MRNNKVDWLTKLYAFVVTLYMFRVYEVIWLYSISASLLALVTISVILARIFLLANKGRVRFWVGSLVPIMLLMLYCYYSMVVTHSHDKFSFVTYSTLFLSMASVIMLSLEEKKYLLKVITLFFVVVLVVSIPYWLLFLSGANLPHSAPIEHSNGYHIYYNYYLFRVSAYAFTFPRFSSVFLEPGQLATPCVFLFFLNAMENKVFSFKNIVLLIAILFSLSLIGYGLLLVSLVFIAWSRGSNYRYVFTVFALLVIGGFYRIFSSNEDSSVNTLILDRLEYDEEKGIAGNNRTARIFDLNYQSFLQSDERYFGIHHRLKTGNDWSNNSSGYKKFIVHHGLVGFAIFLLYILSLYWFNRNERSFVFLIMLLTAFFIRNLLQNPMWMSIAIIGLYTLKNNRRLESETNNKVFNSSQVTSQI